MNLSLHDSGPQLTTGDGNAVDANLQGIPSSLLSGIQPGPDEFGRFSGNVGCIDLIEVDETIPNGNRHLLIDLSDYVTDAWCSRVYDINRYPQRTVAMGIRGTDRNKATSKESFLSWNRMGISDKKQGV